MKQWVPPILAVLVMTIALQAQDISPWLTGSNYWHNLHRNSNVWSQVADANMKVIRIGGNGWERNLPANDTLEEWINDIKGAGAEPIVQIPYNASSGEAASRVRYFNVDNDNRVKFWNIGNEPDLHKRSVESVHDYVLRLARAMKEVDPTILIFAPDNAGPDEPYFEQLVGGIHDITGEKIGETFLIDGISWHRYAFWFDYTREDVMTRVEQGYRKPALRIKRYMDACNAKHGRTGEQKLKWTIGEFNMHVVIDPRSNPELYQAEDGIGINSFLNGQFFAELYGMGMKEEAFYMTSWSIYENGGSRGKTDFSLFDGRSLKKRSSYWHMRLIGENFSGKYVDGLSSNRAFHTFGCSDAGKLCVIVLNRETEGERSYLLKMTQGDLDGDADVVMSVDAGANAEYQDVINRQTTHLLVFTDTGKLVKKITYSLDDYRNDVHPNQR